MKISEHGVATKQRFLVRFREKVVAGPCAINSDTHLAAGKVVQRTNGKCRTEEQEIDCRALRRRL